MTRHYPPPHLTTKEFYFNHVEGLSNSGLTKVEEWLEGKMDQPKPESAFRLGSMVDAMLTQMDELTDDATDEELIKAMKLSDAIKRHPLAKVLIDQCEPQAIVSNVVKVNYQGFELDVPAKAMYDGLLLKMKIARDDKTTSARTEKQFLDAFERFNYDRQAYWYMEIAGLDKMVFVGASKPKPGEVFIHIVKRGDKYWQQGKDKANFLAYYSQLK